MKRQALRAEMRALHPLRHFSPGATPSPLLLRLAFRSAKYMERPARIALYGLAGIGKSQVALEVARFFRHEYREVFWTPASSREQLVQGYAAIAQRLGIHGAGVTSTGGQDIAAVQAWMKRYGRWLLILDGVEANELLDEFLPPVCRWENILWTTRTLTCQHEAMAIAVESLPAPDAERLLFNRFKGDER